MAGIEKDKQNALNYLEKYLDNLIAGGTDKNAKKVSLMSYWMKDYCRYLADEDRFDPKKLKRYERGDIIKVNLGYNVGSEEGGLHYAVVLDKKNQLNSSVITIIPLTSIKDETAPIRYQDVLLGNEIYEKLRIKHSTILKQLEKDMDRDSEELADLRKREDAISSLKDSLSEGNQPTDVEIAITNLIEELETQNTLARQRVEVALDICKKQLNLMYKISNEISKMKSGSVALVGQVTTISKMRIYDPKNKYNVLSGIKASPESLDKLNAKIKELYVFE